MEKKIEGVSFDIEQLKEQAKLGKELFYKRNKAANWTQHSEQDQLKLIDEIWAIASQKESETKVYEPKNKK